MMKDEMVQESFGKYMKKISKKLPVISTHMETLTKFWEQQYSIFESHISTLESMDRNVNIRLSNNLVVGIVEIYTDEKINCKECYQMLNRSWLLKNPLGQKDR